MSKSFSKIIACATILCMLFSATAYAGGGYKGGKKKKTGFFTKIGKSIKRAHKKAVKAVKNAAHKTATAVKNVAHKTANAVKTAVKKTGQAIKKGGANVSNAIHDSGTWVKQKITGKKKKTWVCGHYDKNDKWISGHWRKVESGAKAGSANTPGQSGDAGQIGDFGGGQDAGYPEGGDEGGYEGGDASADEGSTDTGSLEDPVLPEFPEGDGDAAFDGDASQEESADQTSQESTQTSQESSQTSQESSQESSQAAQQSGESDQAAQFKMDASMSLRTMGNLMDDLLVQSQSITEFKRSANPNMSFSVETQDSVNSTYEQRERDARLLARVIVWDLQMNDGNSGMYFNFFKARMKNTTPEQRQLMGDVIEQVRAGVQHGINHADADVRVQFEARLAEIANY